jgi:hypothetical protein
MILDARRPNAPESNRSAHCVLDYGRNASMQRKGVGYKLQRSLHGLIYLARQLLRPWWVSPNVEEIACTNTRF